MVAMLPIDYSIGPILLVDFKLNLLKKNDDPDFQVFTMKMTGHTGLEEKSKK